jgi:HD-GYP domain-containing protein (c-di-GMP phosphodiesterase class II)
VFGISGSLGPSARPLLTRLFQQCLQRRLPRVVLDLSGVEALGAGAARLLNEFAAAHAAAGWRTAFRVSSGTLRSFLSRDPSLPPPPLFATLEGALGAVGARGDRARPAAAAEPRPRAAEADPSQDVDAGLDGLLQALGATAGSQDGGELDVLRHIEATEVEERTPSGQFWRPESLQEPLSEPEQWAAHWRSLLRARKLASRVVVFALQPDGSYYPVLPSGVDLRHGLPYHGLLARRVREQPGPSFLLDLCTEPLTVEEQEVIESLNCAVVARTGGGEEPEMLLFVAKDRAGDDYSLDELQALDELLRHQDAPEAAAPAVPAPPRAPNSLQLRSPASVLGAPAYRESERERLLRRKVAQLRDILGLSRGFDATFGTSRILDVLVLSMVSLARTETVLYFSERAGEFVLTHHRGLDRRSLAEMALRQDSTLVQAALQAEGAVRIEESGRVSEEEQIWARQHGFTYLLPFRAKDRLLGLLLLGTTGSGEPDLEMLSCLLHEGALAYDRAQLYETLHERTLGVVRGLVTLIESCSGQDAGATERVVRYTQALAEEVQYPEASRRELAYGAVLRDIGMLRIDPAILHSSGQLSADQWDVVRRHTLEGATIMRQMRFSDVAVDVVLHHHEAYNGEGYPAGLRGRAIPLGARIVSVAESYVKMTMDRPYRKALGRVEALESLAENWGLRYDPLVVDALVRVVNRELSVGLQGEKDITRDLFGV